MLMIPYLALSGRFCELILVPKYQRSRIGAMTAGVVRAIQMGVCVTAPQMLNNVASDNLRALTRDQMQYEHTVRSQISIYKSSAEPSYAVLILHVRKRLLQQVHYECCALRWKT
jgi:hypothetical protein